LVKGEKSLSIMTENCIENFKEIGENGIYIIQMEILV